MNHSTRHGRPRALMRAVVAVAGAAVLSFGALPALTGTAGAAPKPDIRCDELYKISGVRPGGLPAGDASRVKSLWDTYDYVNSGLQWDGLPAPEPGEVSDDPDDYKKGTKERVYAYWERARTKYPDRWSDFGTWLREAYIPPSGHDPRGKAFEAKVVRDMGLVGPDWICQKEVTFKDPDTGKEYKRTLDAYNKRTNHIVEIKSNGKHDPAQAPKDRAWSKDPKWNGSRYTIVHGQPQKSGTTKFVQELRTNAPNRTVTTYQHLSSANERPPAGGSPYKQGNGLMTPPGQPGARTGGADMINRSQPTPETMRRQIEAARGVPGAANALRGPGGVDFSTLELQYVGKPVKGKGVDYAFSAKEDPEENTGWGGKAKAQLISDSFLTWLALTPDKFWVNLNPDEPDRIMDAKFGTTDAGRVLLEADLRMKHDFYRAMDPKTDLGRRYWAALPKEDGKPCMPGLRNWIEPKPAQVREQDGGIYILDAPLRLKSTAQTTSTPGPGEPICTPDEAETAAAQTVIDAMIVPAVEKQINTEPQYADLRRVYNARVAAEFVRQQDAEAPTDYRSVINSNDVSKWPLRAPNEKWDKNELFQEYRKIYTEGEFQYDVPTAGGTMIYIVGGVDMSKAPKKNVSAEQFRSEHRYLPRTKDTSVKAMTNDAERDGTLFLGGNTAGENPGSKPDPTPSPTKPADPGDGEPSSPAPDPSSAGGEPSDPVTGKEPDGDLADTGSGTPVGLISAIAVAIVALGGALVWWMRRRKAGTAAQ
ncbi:hypothetical protein [Streptomyces niveus]|uniref:hypothetical protein n=1 Tax=Streptomyces niveus TaxID=193462 RepID=UPI0020D2676F|nr:hypothetical protein [Streptomyces niveus]